MKSEYFTFPNLGIQRYKFTDEELAPIREEVNLLSKNFSDGPRMGKSLVGNIEYEYRLTDKTIKYIDNLLGPMIFDYDDSCKLLSNLSVLTESRPLILENAWVNFQQKHEFNPIHTHTGVLSFVIWLEIPYFIKDEIEASPGKNSGNPLAGHFAFHYTNTIGEVQLHQIPADKSMENTALLFPSKLNHSVFPFYSSDKKRISVSGNFRLQV